MPEEIQEAVQILRVMFEGVEIAIKIGRGGLHAAKDTVDALVGLMEHEKTLGKTNVKKLVAKGGDLQVFQFATKDRKKVERLLKRYGILYSVLPDVNKKDGLSEIIFHTEALPRVNNIAEKLKGAKVESLDEYLQGDGGERKRGLFQFLKRTPREKTGSLLQKVGLYVSGKKAISLEELTKKFRIAPELLESILKQLVALGVLGMCNEQGMYPVRMDKAQFKEQFKGYEKLFQRIRAMASSKDTHLVDILITKNMILTENRQGVLAQIPGQFHGEDRFFWIAKEDLMDTKGGRLTFLDPHKEYEIRSKDGKTVEKVKGEELCGRYDRTETEVKERFQKSQKKQGKPTQKKKTPKKRG